MQDFTRPSGRLRALPVAAHAVYSIFLAFTLLGLVLIDEPEIDGGPALVIPEDGEDLAVFEPMPRRKLLELMHFHLFSMPVYLLILCHMYMLSRARKGSKAAWIALATFSTLLHVAAPWLIAYRCAASVAVYAASGSLMLLSYAWMSLVPLWEMWRR